MLTREELHQLVWSKPMTKVAEQFGVSGTYLARVCASLQVPRPDRGYWAKLKVGKVPAIPPLPEAHLYPQELAAWQQCSVQALAKLAEARASPQQTRQDRRRIQVSALPTIAQALGVSVEALIGEPVTSSKRSPAPKLQQQLERITGLSKAQQHFVLQMIDTVLQQQTGR